MKKLFPVFGIMTLAVSLTFVACKKDDSLQTNKSENSATKSGPFATANLPEYEINACKIISSTEYLANEIKSGKLIDYSQSNINQYAKKFDIGIVTSDMASAVYLKISNPELNFRAELNNINLSQLSKEVITEVFTNAEAMSIDEYQRYLTRKTGEIKKMNITAEEQNKLLTICSIAIKATNSDMLKGDGSDFGKRNNMVTLGSPAGVLAGVIIGGGIGFLVAGPAGAVIGAATGFAVGVK